MPANGLPSPVSKVTTRPVRSETTALFAFTNRPHGIEKHEVSYIM